MGLNQSRANMKEYREFVTYLGKEWIQFRNPLSRMGKEEEGSLIFSGLVG